MAQNLMTDKPNYPDSVALVTPQRDRTQPNKFNQVNLSVSNKGEIEARMQELNSLKQNRYVCLVLRINSVVPRAHFKRLSARNRFD